MVATATAPRIDWASETDLLGEQLVAEIEAYLAVHAPQPEPPRPTPAPPWYGRHLQQWNHGLEHPTPTLLDRIRGHQPRIHITTRQYLQLISRYIQQHGWTQGQLWTPAGQVCILGARAEVLAAGYGTPAIDEHARLLIGNQTLGPIDDWNDQPGRRLVEVHTMLRYTIDAAS